MVKKLFKYEFAAYIRTLLPVYVILLVISLFTRVIQLFETDSIFYNIVSGSSYFFFVVSMVVSTVLTFITAITRFYKNLFTGEGYLTFTLPVTPAAHIWVKALTAVFYEVFTLLMIGVSLVVAVDPDVLTEIGKAISYLWGNLPKEWLTHLPLYIGEFVLYILVSCFGGFMLYYTCIAIGQLAKKNRVLMAFGVYFIYYAITQVISTICTAVLTIFSDSIPWEIVEDFFIHHTIGAIHLVLGILLFFSLLMSLVYFLITHFIIRNKLNLE